MGYGAAIAVILFLISAGFIFVYLWRTFQTELEY
jgi:ABC-type sugar transport system permease subunit